MEPGWSCAEGHAVSCCAETRICRRIPAFAVLTDASPNDAVQESAFGKNYEGNTAVEDAADAVKKLRADGIRTAAVFHGSTSHLENLYRIYGKEYIRVQSLQQFSGSVADLIRMALSEDFQLR